MSECVGLETQKKKIQAVEPIFDVLGNKIILKMIATSGDTFKIRRLVCEFSRFIIFSSLIRIITPSNHQSRLGCATEATRSSLGSNDETTKRLSGWVASKKGEERLAVEEPVRREQKTNTTRCSRFHPSSITHHVFDSPPPKTHR